MHLLTLLCLLQTKMTDFPPLSYTLTSEIPTLSYIWGLKKVPLLCGASPYSLIGTKQELSWDKTTALQRINSLAKKKISNKYLFNQSENNTQMKETLTKHSVLVYSFPQQISIICRAHFTVLMEMLLHFTKNRCLTPLNILEKKCVINLLSSNIHVVVNFCVRRRKNAS